MIDDSCTILEFVDLLHGKKYIVRQIFVMAMQDVINKMKGTALGVAEYLTPVLKVMCIPLMRNAICKKFLFNTICRFAPLMDFIFLLFTQESKFQETGVITPEEVYL